MNTKDLPAVSTQASQDPPHRAMSRAPANHNVMLTALGLLIVAGVFGVLWALYTLD